MGTKSYTVASGADTKADRTRYVLPLWQFVNALPDLSSRREFAARCGTSLGRLRNVMYGLAPSNPKLSVLIEKHTGGVVTRFHLHPDDFSEIWPESSVALGAKSKSGSTVETV